MDRVVISQAVIGDFDKATLFTSLCYRFSVCPVQSFHLLADGRTSLATGIGPSDKGSSKLRKLKSLISHEAIFDIDLMDHDGELELTVNIETRPITV